MLLLWTVLAACAPDDVDFYTVDVLVPNEGCVRDGQMEGPPDGVCNDVSVVHVSPDGTCWYVPCMWEDMQFPENAGGSGVPADPDWCRDPDWFFEQPRCDDTDG